MKQKIIIFLLLFLSLLHAKEWDQVLRTIEKRFPNVKTISTDELKGMMDRHEKFVVIDVRKPAEFRVSHIKGAVNIEKPNQIKYGKNELMVVYCSVGYRSSQFVSELQKMGFTNAYNLRGSIFEWANKGYDLYQNGKKVDKVHPYNKEWGKLLKQPNTR